MQEIERLGLKNHVRFSNKFLLLEEILEYLSATDVYISTNVNKNQIVSGTLSYAMGCGRAIISHPFLHAQEIVSPERGILVEHRNSESYKKAIIKLLSDKDLIEKMDKNAYEYTRPMLLSNVAESYVKIFRKYL